jgi:hypothetical protein
VQSIDYVASLSPMIVRTEWEVSSKEPVRTILLSSISPSGFLTEFCLFWKKAVAYQGLGTVFGN